MFISRKRTICILVIFSWIWSIFLAFPPLLGWGAYLPEGNWMRYFLSLCNYWTLFYQRKTANLVLNCTSCAPSWTFPSDKGNNLLLFSFGFFLPLLIILSTSISVVRTVSQALGTICERDLQKKAMKKQFKVICLVS